ncbi:MAG: hypothetical protein LBU25_09155 [Treponema sp.]|jgi:hypothetical protein|nr:hypothetical protein [Treponema sp.]
MKGSFIPALLLSFCTAITFTGCDGAIAPTADIAPLNPSGPGEGSAAAISGTLTLVEGTPVVQDQGNNYYIKGSLPMPGEGTALTVTGEAAPILGRDAEGNSLFFGYSLKAETVTLNR